MSYICDVCNTAFDEPLIVKRNVNLNGWFESTEEALCPICNNPYISKAEPCACGGLRRAHALMCRSCREDLAKRVNDFFDGLTAEEEQQFDDWMDGDTITNRKAWK